MENDCLSIRMSLHSSQTRTVYGWGMLQTMEISPNELLGSRSATIYQPPPELNKNTMSNCGNQCKHMVGHKMCCNIKSWTGVIDCRTSYQNAMTDKIKLVYYIPLFHFHFSGEEKFFVDSRLPAKIQQYPKSVNMQSSSFLQLQL